MSFLYGMGTPNSSWNSRAYSEAWADPFGSTYASLVMPEQNPIALRMCEFIFHNQGTYREAARRLLAYFITDLEFEKDSSDDAQDKWREFLEDTLDYKNLLRIIGMDLMCYGNSFTSVIPTFVRHLMCKCGQVEFPFKTVAYEPNFHFSFDNFQFVATCPRCRHRGAWRVHDRRSADHSGFRIKRWSPHDIEILHENWGDEKRFIWKIPEDYRRQIRDGNRNLLVIEHAPKQVISAVQNNNHLMFEKGFVFHMIEDALAGVVNRGWGISRVLTNFRQSFHVQVFKRHNEVLGLDYVMPFRVVTPVPGDKSTGQDILLNQNAGAYMAQIHAMFRRRRQDPAGFHSLPFPVQYQALGGDAKALVPRELIEQANEELLNSIGVPQDLYRSTLTIQAAPTALRLFEASNKSIPDNFNRWLDFVINKAGSMLRWEPAKVRLERVTYADDANRQITKLQLGTQGEIAKSDALKSIGIRYKDTVRQMMDDQQFLAEQTAKLQDRMDQAAQMKQMFQQAPAGQPGQPGQDPNQGGQAPQQQQGAGGMAAPGMAGQDILAGLQQGPNEKTSPEDMFARADYLTNQLLGMSESEKDSTLRRLAKIAPALHPIVKDMLDQKRRNMRRQGGQQVSQQLFGKASEARDTLTASAEQVTKQAAAALQRVRAPRRVYPRSQDD